MNTTRKNALIIAYNDLNNSGVPNVIYQTIKSLHNEYNFDIVVFGENEYYFQQLRKENIINVNLIRIHDNKPKSRLKRFFWYLTIRNKNFYHQTLSLATKKQYDVVHSFKEYDSWPFLKACQKAGIRKRIIHGTVIHNPKGNLFNKFLFYRTKKGSLKYANCFIGVSDFCCQSTFPKKKYTVIFNGYDMNAFNNGVKNKLPQDSLVLTQVGTFNDNKNQLFSLEIIRELIRIYPNSRLKLIGKETGRGYLEKMKNFISDNHLEASIEIIDGTKGIGNHFEFTTFSLLPSKQEGAGITAIESQACGLKVFASSNVTSEMNAGGLISISLNSGAKYWANKIYDEFKKVGNTRQQYDLEKFSHKSFTKSIKSIYTE